MIEQQGRVVGLDGADALVAVGGRSGCAACDAGRGCGAGIFGRLLDRFDEPIRVPNSLGLAPGQVVKIGLTENAFLGLALRLYGVPLCLGLLGGTAAWLLFLTPTGRSGWMVDAAVLAGAALSGAWGLRRARRRLDEAFTRFSPVMLDAVSALDCRATDRIA